jgi:signal transduction histidine kinase
MWAELIERTGDADLRRTFEAEMSALLARRMRLGIGLFLSLVGMALTLDYYYFPADLVALVTSYAGYVVICSVQLAVVHLAGASAVRATTLATSALGLTMSASFLGVSAPVEILGLMLVIFETGLLILYPWGWRGQLLGCVGAAVGYVIAAFGGAVSAGPRPLGIMCVWIGTGLTVFGAHLIDLHRFASYRHATNLARVNAVLDGILDVFRQMRSSAALPDLLHAICRRTVESFSFSRAAIFFRDERTGGAVSIASYGVPQRIAMRVAAGDPRPEEALGRKEILAGRPVVLTRSQPLPEADRRWLDATELHTLAMFPLSVGETLGGAMYLGIEEAREFTPEQIRSLEVVANHAASAILLARYFRDTEQAARFRTGLSALAVRLNAEAERARGMEVLCAEAHSLFGATGSVLLVAQDDKLVSVAAAGVEGVVPGALTVPLGDEANVAVRALQQREVAVASGLGNAGRPPAVAGFRSVLAVPLVDTAPPAVLLVGDAADPRRFGRWITQQAKVFRTLVEGALRNLDLVDRLAEANKAKDRLLASASHDLRTPLSVIIGYTQLALEGDFGELSPDLRDVLARVSANAAAQLSLVEDLMTLSRLELGRISIEPAATPLGPLLSEMGFVAEGLVRRGGPRRRRRPGSPAPDPHQSRFQRRQVHPGRGDRDPRRARSPQRAHLRPRYRPGHRCRGSPAHLRALRAAFRCRVGNGRRSWTGHCATACPTHGRKHGPGERCGKGLDLSLAPARRASRCRRSPVKTRRTPDEPRRSD